MRPEPKIKTAVCPACNQRKHSATVNTDGLCDGCRGGRQEDAHLRCRRCGCLQCMCTPESRRR